MYYFNLKLMRELDKVMGVSHSELCRSAGFGLRRTIRWSEDPSMTVYEFVEFLNRFRFSMADFLISKEEVPVVWKKEAYVIPIDIWTPVEWDPSKIADILKRGNDANVNSLTGLAKLMGLSCSAPVANWINNAKSMKMPALIEMLNKLHIDAKELIVDRNKAIGTPEWETQSVQIVKGLEKALEDADNFRKQLKDKDRLIMELQLHIKELKRENAALKELTNTSIVAEPPAPYFPLRKREYVFHDELWHSLPDLFGMTKKDFCQLVGLHPTLFFQNNVDISILVKACNELRISVSHFFLKADEPKVVQHRGFYEMSPQVFRPIEDRSENLELVLHKQTFGFTKKQFCSVTGMGHRTIEAISSGRGHHSKVVSLLDICNRMGIPLGVFLYDPNKLSRNESFSTLNETLAVNCIEMYKELKNLKKNSE